MSSLICISVSFCLTLSFFDFLCVCVCIQGERNRIMKQQQLEQEENLARELERVKFEQLKDEKMRQQIRETR